MRRPELLLPRGDTYTAPIEATERALLELPLDDCARQYDPQHDLAYFEAPPGKAFRVTAPKFKLDCVKPLYVSRSESDGPIPEDPLSLERFAPWESPDIGEHIATRLTVRTNGRILGTTRNYIPDDWTAQSRSVSSDEVRVEVILLDAPQTWTVHGLTTKRFPVNSSRYSPTIPWVGYSADAMFVASRQAIIGADIGSAQVELVDINMSELVPEDGKARSPDGRLLQIAGTPDPKPDGEAIQVVDFSKRLQTAEDRDDFMMEYDYDYHRLLSHLPQQTRLEQLWRSRRETMGGQRPSFYRHPYSDDPLQHMLIVTNHVNGKTPDMEEIMYYLGEMNRLAAMTMHEVEDEAKLPPTTESYAREGTSRFQIIQHGGALATTVSMHCRDGWELSAGQLARCPVLFGWRRFPGDVLDQARQLSDMSLEEAVGEFATVDWLVRDHDKSRIAERPPDFRYDEFIEIMKRVNERH